MSKMIDLTGYNFNYIKVLNRARNNKSGRAMWNCICFCGKSTIVIGKDLRNGKTRSCGCKQGRDSHTHRMSKSKTYSTYNNMKNRCYYKKTKAYKHYGGRGIKVCDRWLNSFENFLDDMGERPNNFTIERIDVNGNYEPNNCKWASTKEQALNKRPKITLTFRSQTLSLINWAKILEIPYQTIYYRYKKNFETKFILNKYYGENM